MKEKIKKTVKKYPILEKDLRIMFTKQKIRDTKSIKFIQGNDNTFSIDKSAILNNCKFDIIGDNNRIEINVSSILNNVKFYIRGNKNNILIGNHVWIASHVSIHKGVNISDNSIVAARASATKSFLENNILNGESLLKD